MEIKKKFAASAVKQRRITGKNTGKGSTIMNNHKNYKTASCPPRPILKTGLINCLKKCKKDTPKLELF